MSGGNNVVGESDEIGPRASLSIGPAHRLVLVIVGLRTHIETAIAVVLQRQ
jgi:hypothetical protein